MKKLIAAAFVMTVAVPVVSAAWGDEPDGLILPAGFHATDYWIPTTDYFQFRRHGHQPRLESRTSGFIGRCGPI